MGVRFPLDSPFPMNKTTFAWFTVFLCALVFFSGLLYRQNIEIKNELKKTTQELISINESKKREEAYLEYINILNIAIKDSMDKNAMLEMDNRTYLYQLEQLDKEIQSHKIKLGPKEFYSGGEIVKI